MFFSDYLPELSCDCNVKTLRKKMYFRAIKVRACQNKKVILTSHSKYKTCGCVGFLPNEAPLSQELNSYKKWEYSLIGCVYLPD